MGLPRWLPTNSVMELNAQEAAAHMLDGTAALMACTVLPQLLTAHLLPRRLLLPRWLPTSSVMELNAQEAAAHFGWYCCPDGMYCAATAADCPFVAKKALVAKMAANKQCDGTECPGGCCPYVGWYCCPDGMYCAATAADCPYAKNYHQKLASRQH